MFDVIRSVGTVLTSSWRASRSRLLVSATLMLLGGLSAPLIAVFLGSATDAAVHGQRTVALVAGAAVALVALTSLTMEHFAHIFFFELADLHQIRVERELGALVQGTVGMNQLERQDYADRLELLRKETASLGEGVQTSLSSITLLVQITLTAILLARLNPWLLLLPVFAVPPLIAGRLADKARESAELATAEDNRLGWHLLRLAVSSSSAKELRLFGLQTVMRERQAALLRTIDAKMHRPELGGLLLRVIGQLLYAAGYVGAVVLVVRDAIAGQHSVGDVVLLVTLAVQTNAQAAGAVAVARSLQRNARALAWLRWLRRETDSAEDATATAVPPDRLADGISLTGVSFRYPGTDRDVLSDVTARIPAGTTVAVVGDNGAGKSTLVKLLCRLYEPTGGQITVDGVDLRTISATQWRSRISAGFQDFVKINSPAYESIGVGEISLIDDRPAIVAAVRRADAEAVIDQLPDGLDTPVGKAYEDGAELSGGQWQRLALSRAMMRAEPLLLVLDEPTSALDPLTEHALFERYAAAATAASARTGGVTVLVSHRFSTVRMANLILVISDGRIAEAGDHQTLLAHQGIYAELFGMQAAAYH